MSDADVQYQSFRKELIEQGVYTRDYLYYGIYAVLCIVGVALSLYFITVTANLALQILNSIFLSFVLVQTGMLGHDLSHGQVFKSRGLNRFAAIIAFCLFGGLSESKWFEKHTAHHLNTNVIDKDPDLDIPFIFMEAQREHLTFTQRLILPYQHIVFFVALPFIYLDQVAHSLLHIFRNFTRIMFLELALMGAHFLILFGMLFYFLPPMTAVLFLIVNIMCIGIYMSLVFAPNHKGKEILHPEKEGSWQDQITMTRNLIPKWYTFQFFGGLNFQIEHHLFPGAARTRHFTIHRAVKEFCKREGLPYYEVTWRESMREIYDALHIEAIRGR